MHRIDTVGANDQNGFKVTPPPATVVGPLWLTAVQEEICNGIELLGGAALNKADNAQLAGSISSFVADHVETLVTADAAVLASANNTAAAGDAATLEAAASAIAPTRSKLERVITDATGGDEALDTGNADQLLSAILAMIGRALSSSIKVTAAADGQIEIFGVIVKWGGYRSSITGEVVRSVVFPEEFPNACWRMLTQPMVAYPSIYQDLWTQGIISEVSAAGFSVQFQDSDNADSAAAGFDWFAIGN